MSDVSNVIYAAMDLFAGGDGWGQSHDAVDKRGEPVSLRSSEAVRFCLRGAIAKVCMMDGRCTCQGCQPNQAGAALFGRAMDAINCYTMSRFSMDPVVFNDTHSYEDVMLAMKHTASAIE